MELTKIDLSRVPVLPILDTIERALGTKVYMVGGCVRDLLMRRHPKDYDLAIKMLPQEAMDRLRQGGFNVVPTGIQYGTISVFVDNWVFELTTFRIDGRYEDGRRPTDVKLGVSLEEDLKRRDFTMNSMAVDLDGNLVDPFGGASDIRRGIVRTVDPVRRFTEDGLRPMRALRFMAQLGFGIDLDTLWAIPKTLGTFANVATERIGQEFIKMASCGDRLGFAESLRLMYHSGMMATWEPRMISVEPSIRFGYSERDPIGMLAVTFNMLHPDVLGTFLFEKVRMSGQDCKKVLALTNLYRDSDFYRSRPPETRRRTYLAHMNDMSQLNTSKTSTNWWTDIVATGVGKELDEVLEGSFLRKDMQLTGFDISREFGIKEGPQVGELLKCVYEYAVTNRVPNNTLDLLEASVVVFGRIKQCI